MHREALMDKPRYPGGPKKWKVAVVGGNINLIDCQGVEKYELLADEIGT
jgi:hypothetical protein